MDSEPHADGLGAFRKARDRLRAEYAGGGLSPQKKAVFSAATLSRLLKPESEYDSSQFSLSIRERLIWSLSDDAGPSVYGGIEELMGQSPISRQIIKENFQGDYRIFRYTKASPHTPDPDSQDGVVSPMMQQRRLLELEFVEERLCIFFDDMKEPAFHYWGREWQEEDPEIAGAVFYSLGKLYLTGAARDTMSMGIISVTRTTEPMQGFWTSTFHKGVRAPFSARILLVHEGNETLLAALRDSAKGPELFLNITDGGYAYYMTMS